MAVTANCECGDEQTIWYMYREHHSREALKKLHKAESETINLYINVELRL